MAKKTEKVKNEEVRTDEAKESNLGNSEASENGTQNATETDRTLTDDSSRKEEKLEEAQKSDENNDTAPPKPEGHIIEPIAYAVKLRPIHPQANYGRAGFRFTKTEETVIEVSDITPEQVILLAEDPWLELVPVCEE